MESGKRVTAKPETHIQQTQGGGLLLLQTQFQCGRLNIFFEGFFRCTRQTVKMLPVGGVIQCISAVFCPAGGETGIFFCEDLLEHFQKLTFFHPPFRSDEPFGIGIGIKAHHGHIVGQDGENFFQCCRVFIFVQRGEWVLCIFCRHFCALQYHELMKFYGGKRQICDFFCGIQPILFRFSGQTEDQVCGGRDVPCVKAFYGICGTGEIVSAIDPRQCFIVGSLYAQFH